MTLPGAAAERDVFFGTWGTEQQCAGTPIKPGGTVMAAPFEIGAEWLRHGAMWCRLNWYPVQARDGGAFGAAQAQCGEDAARGYYLRLERAEDVLTLRWGFQLSSGPLRQCPQR